MFVTPLFLIFLQSIKFGASAQVLYEIKDLEVLEREKNFEDFLMHINDIRPSERNNHWREMFQNMAMGLVDYKIKTQDFSLETFKKIEQIGRSSAMNNDEFFQLKRSIYAKKYFSECFRKASLFPDSLNKNNEKGLCETELNSFWYFFKKDPDIGLDIAAILENYGPSTKKWPFYEKAVVDNMANLYCKKPLVQRAIMDKLYEETYNLKFDGSYKNLINKIVSENCFNEMISPLKGILGSIKSNGLEKEMAFNILEAKGKLSQDELDLYAILYLLDGPVVGDKMNIAWKKIEDLGENYQKRQKLLEQIEKLPIIPDKIFKDPNLPRHKAIINLFAKNFPEYLNYYGSACIKYINNSETAPINVSSSFQCNEFLNAAISINKEKDEQSIPWVSDTVKRQFSGLKK